MSETYNNNSLYFQRVTHLAKIQTNLPWGPENIEDQNSAAMADRALTYCDDLWQTAINPLQYFIPPCQLHTISWETWPDI